MNHDLSRWSTYLGGGAVVLGSSASRPETDAIESFTESLTHAVVPINVEDITLVIGSIVLVANFAFQIYKDHRDYRDRRRKEKCQCLPSDMD